MTSPDADADALFRDGTSRPPAEGRDLVRQAADLGHAPANAWLAADDRPAACGSGDTMR